MSSDTLPTCDEPPAPGSRAEYETRRCAICGAKYPCFGFGPPMTRPGVTIWACGRDRGEVEKRLRTHSATPPSDASQPALL